MHASRSNRHLLAPKIGSPITHNSSEFWPFRPVNMTKEQCRSQYWYCLSHSLFSVITLSLTIATDSSLTHSCMDVRMKNFRAFCRHLLNQVMVLAWKNRVLKIRHWSTLLCELALPCLIMFALVQIKMAIQPSNTAQSFPSEFNYVSQTGVLSPSYDIFSFVPYYQ